MCYVTLCYVPLCNFWSCYETLCKVMSLRLLCYVMLCYNFWTKMVLNLKFATAFKIRRKKLWASLFSKELQLKNLNIGQTYFHCFESLCCFHNIYGP